MDIESILILTIMIFVAATLYSSIGHAGASGFLAAMALFSMAPLEMKPTALSLNVLVATIATVKYLRADCFSWPLFWPFALVSIPFAYLGGQLNPPAVYYNPIIGAVLIYAAWRIIKDANKPVYAPKPPHTPSIILSGAGLGFLSGLTGIGGGIFLSPLLIAFQWVEIKKISGITSAFILVNSVAGLIGFLTSSTPHLPDGLPFWAAAAAFGGFIGASYGSKHFGNPVTKYLLGLILLAAGIKMIVL